MEKLILLLMAAIGFWMADAAAQETRAMRARPDTPGRTMYRQPGRTQQVASPGQMRTTPYRVDSPPNRNYPNSTMPIHPATPATPLQPNPPGSPAQAVPNMNPTVPTTAPANTPTSTPATPVNPSKPVSPVGR